MASGSGDRHAPDWRTPEVTPANAGTARAAFFDLDETLLGGHSGAAILAELCGAGLVPWRLVAEHAVAAARLRLLGSNPELAERALSQIAAGLSEVETEPQQRLIDGAVERARLLLVPALLERVRMHQADGDRVFVVTASIDAFAARFALRLGIDGGLGSTLHASGGPSPAATPNYGEAKATALRVLATEHGLDLASSAAYSDSISDLPMLESVGRPVAVNADRSLRRVAAARGWETIDHPGLRCHLTNARAFRSGAIASANAA